MYSVGNGQGENASHPSRNILLSFTLFVAAYLLLGALSLQSAYFSIACPVISTAMILVCPNKLPVLDNRNPEPGKGTASDGLHAASQAGFAGTQQEADYSEKAAQESPCVNPPSNAAVPGADGAPLSNEGTFRPAVPVTDAVDGPSITSFARAYGLSQRETELASYAYRNYSAKRIAAELYIAESTVYTHLKRIYRKADVHSKQELIDLIDHFGNSHR